MATVKDLKDMDVLGLQKALEDSHQELFNLRFRLSTKQLVNHREVRRVRRNIARIKTMLREKELEIG